MISWQDMGVSTNREKTPKMDGENNGKPFFEMDDLGVPLFSETPILIMAQPAMFEKETPDGVY